MRRFTIRIVALLLTFTIGASVTYIFHKCFLQFGVVAMGSTHMEPDGYGGFTSYKSYDGVNLSFDSMRFPSRESAAVAFQNTLKDAVKVIEREPLYDLKGETVVGERVVAMFPPNAYVQTEWASVICLDDRKIYQISSPSLRHALFFDKKYRRY